MMTSWPKKIAAETQVRVAACFECDFTARGPEARAPALLHAAEKRHWIWIEGEPKALQPAPPMVR